MILLDTNIISELMRLKPNDQVIQDVNNYPAESTFISVVTHAEILQGVALLDDGKRKQILATTALQILNLFDNRTLAFDKHSSPFYADIIQQCTSKGRPIDFPDAQIAAITMQYELTLFTRNIRDFEDIDGLRLHNPWG
jgi:predicted nucleic acid-binding protein